MGELMEGAMQHAAHRGRQEKEDMVFIPVSGGIVDGGRFAAKLRRLS